MKAGRYLLIFLGTLLAGSISLVYALGNGQLSAIRNAEISDPGREGAHRFWSEKIDRIEAEETYEEFKKANSHADFNQRHALSHFFGELLYEKVGIEGMGICNHDFGDFGCYHGFVLTAVSRQGIPVTRQLNEFCKNFIEKSLEPECQHGLGHGLLEYLGHEKIDEALGACADLSGDHIGCLMGVFMEYNVTAIKSGSPMSLARKLDPEDPYAPCNAVTEELREACWRVLPQWWDVVFEKDYKKIGVLCYNIEKAGEREACFRGVGNVAPHSSNFDPEKTIKKCRAMPTTSEEIFCRSVASQGFYSLPEYRKLAPTLCQGLNKDGQDACATLTKLPE